MNKSDEQDKIIASMTFSSIYPLYLAKILKKDRTEKELLIIIEWLTGFDQEKIMFYIDQQATFLEFFKAATLNPKASLIKGMICGSRVEEIDNALTQKVRYLDKLVDELAKGKSMDKILRN